jgi:hypothetical protein
VTEAAIEPMAPDSDMECTDGRHENVKALLESHFIFPMPSNGNSNEAVALDHSLASTLEVDDNSSSVAMHSPGRLVLNCIMHDFTGYGIVCFFPHRKLVCEWQRQMNRTLTFSPQEPVFVFASSAPSYLGYQRRWCSL